MKRKNLLVLFAVAVIVLIMAFSLVACNDNDDNDNGGNDTVEYTVTFNYGGGVYNNSSSHTAKVESGKTVAQPAAPTKEGNNFTGWYLGEVAYNFETPVTGDITLTAKWEIAKYTVTFDTLNGSAVSSQTVEYGSNAFKPLNPTKVDCYFDGWYVGGVPYDFNSNVTSDITITAKWADVATVNKAFSDALRADYSNFTSSSTVTDETASYTDIFKQTDIYAYWESGSALYEDHFLIFDDAGKMLAMYYLHEDSWQKSGLVSYADFVVSLYLDEISVEDVSYSEGVYRVYDESVASVVYALFRSTESYTDFYIQIKDGRLYKVWGNLSGDYEYTHEQTFYDYGETQLSVPSDIPAVSVNISKNTKETEVGVAIDIDELIGFLFTVKVEGKDFAITSDMISLGGLNVENPAEGTFTITLSFETWDGATHIDSTTVTVKAAQAEETFADIFAKDYSNVTMISGSSTFKYVNGVYNGSNAYYYIENDGSLTKYHATTFSETKNATMLAPRLEIIFNLNPEIFEQVGDSNTYMAKNVTDIEPVIVKMFATSSMKLNKNKDYSISLTIELGRIVKIDYSYCTGTSSTPTNKSYTLSNFGTTVIDIPDEILAKRETAATTSAETAYIENRKNIA